MEAEVAEVTKAAISYQSNRAIRHSKQEEKSERADSGPRGG